MDRKIVMGVAAVAGIGLLLYLRKSGDSSAIGASGSMLGAAAAANNWASQPYVITTNTKAPAVVDNSPKSPAPAPAPSASSGGASWGGGSNQTGSGDLGGGLNSKGEWVYADGSIYKGPSVTDKQAMSIMGY